MFKIECNGPFREGRTMALLSSMVTQNLQNIDITIIADDGVSIPANKQMLAWQSKYLAEALHSVPCCSSSSISLPFNSVVVKNLLAVISCGVSLPLSRDDLLNVKVAADELDIKLGQLEVEKSEVKHLNKKSVKKRLKEISPEPYHQNDHVQDDEIVEITPEIFTPNDDDEEGGFAHHFLMQEYGDDSSAVSSPMSSVVSTNEPELIEIPAEDAGGEKKFKCSFCPNKIFKKKPEVNYKIFSHMPSNNLIN